jgi:hypothetical protein
MGMANYCISANAPLLEESFDTYSAALNWYPDRLFSHNPLLFGRHLIDYIYFNTPEEPVFTIGFAFDSGQVKRMFNVPFQIRSRA